MCHFYHVYFHVTVKKLLEFKPDLSLLTLLIELRIAKGLNISNVLTKNTMHIWKSTFLYHFISQVLKELVKFKGTSTTFHA